MIGRRSRMRIAKITDDDVLLQGRLGKKGKKNQDDVKIGI